MASNSNNSFILIVIIFFIIFVLFINCNSNIKNDNNNYKNNSEKFESFSNIKKINFDTEDKVKYFDNSEPPNNISDINKDIEINIEEFDYGDNVDLSNDYEQLNINKDSNELVSYDEVKDTDSIAEKFNKLIGKIETDITEENLITIKGEESKIIPSQIKTKYIYNNDYKVDTINNNNKYESFNENGYRKYIKNLK